MAEFKGIYCAECEQLLGVILSDFTISTSYDTICILCADNFTLVADTLGFISPNGWAGCIEKLPSQQDLIKLQNENNFISRYWHEVIKKWSKDTRDEHQANKIRKLQNGSD